MMVFQESMLERGLAEYCLTEDAAPDSVMVLIHYAAVMAGECLETIDGLKEEVVHNDLMVGVTVCSSFWMRLTVPSHSVIRSSWTSSPGTSWGRRSTRSFILG